MYAYKLAVWCVGDFKQTTLLAKPILHCGECSAYAVHFGLIKSCEQKYCCSQWQVARWLELLWQVHATNEPWHSHELFVSFQERRPWAPVARGAIESCGPIERRTLSPLTRYGCAGSGDALLLSSIHAPPTFSCSSGTLSKLKYIHSLAKRLNSDAV